MKWYLLFLLYPLFSYSEPQEFTLYVKTQTPIKSYKLTCTKLGDIQPELFNFAKQLLEFDLNQSGFLQPTQSVNAQVIQLSAELLPETIRIKINYLAKERILDFSFSSFSKQTIQNSIHKVADELIYELFGEYGIFSDRILYTVKDPHAFSSEVFIKNFDLLPGVQQTFDGEFKLTPFFLQKGNEKALQFGYVSYASGPSKIYKQDLGQKNPSILIQLRGSQFLPSISYHADFLSFISDATGSVDLFVQRLNQQFIPEGKPVQIFSSSNAVQATSSFNPKGNLLAFVSDFEKVPKIYQLDLLKTLKVRKKADIERLSPIDTEATCPAYSPDGTKLAYSAPIEGIRQIFIYDFENQIHFPITSGAGHKENPSWAANSLHLAYNTTGAENEIYIINLNQKTPIKITQEAGLKHYPCWERTKKRKIKDSN